jgi:predicted metal-dependent hydrolase
MTERAPRGATIMQGGRAKAYRPLPAAEREAALSAALEAYDRTDFFLAHELLEPAWMGADDMAERELYQGLIKLAAAFVHGVRGNPLGIAKNLAGARDRLTAARAAGADQAGIDLDVLLADIDQRLALLARDVPPDAIEPPTLRRSAQ